MKMKFDLGPRRLFGRDLFQVYTMVKESTPGILF